MDKRFIPALETLQSVVGFPKMFIEMGDMLRVNESELLRKASAAFVPAATKPNTLPLAHEYYQPLLPPGMCLRLKLEIKVISLCLTDYGQMALQSCRNGVFP
jgi:hypothetical protein